jgi:arylsulfatase A-like enzyme
VLELRSRLVRAARWLAPSLVAAFAAALVASIVDAIGGGPGGFALITGAGFIALLVVPVLVAASAIVRGVVAAWQPGDLHEPAPRLAAWLIVIGVDTVVLAAIAFRGVRWFAGVSAFAPMEVAYFSSTLVSVTAVALVILSGPQAREVTVFTRWIARRRPGLVRPRAILGLAAGALAVALAIAWFTIVLPSLGAFDTSVFYAPASALGVAIAMHVAWARLGRARLAAGASLVGIGVVMMGLAVLSVRVSPTTTLEIWGDRSLAGLAIDRLFDLDRIRNEIPISTYRPVVRPGADHPDIILVTIDTVRADHTPPYGGHAEMPTLAALAQGGTVFDWAFSPSNVTRRSIPSMILGLPADRVRGRVVGWALRIDPRHVVLAERLRAGGYETAGFMCCDGFWGSEMRTGLQRGLEHLEIEHDGTKLARRARTWLEQREQLAGNRPLFLWIHILEPHNWTAITGDPHNDDERTRYYDRVLGMCDAMLGDLVAAFHGAAKPPIFVVTADHGEALGEHGHAFHSTDLYDSQIHVPLVMSGPGVAAQRVTETVSSTNLVPTLLELAGFEPPSGRAIDGASFAALATGARASRPDGVAFAAMIKDRSNPGGVTAIVEGTWKLIKTGGKLELYDIAKDPDEHTDLAGREPAQLAHMLELLRAKQREARVSPFE